MTKRASTVLRSLSLAILGVFLLAATQMGLGQDINASLSGTVADSSGAAIPEAQLTLTNEATRFTANVVSNGAGEYTFRNLTPGKYDLVVSAKGFKSTTQPGIELAINQAARVDVSLTVGRTDETVTVTADASLINYENQTLEGGVSPEALQDFPLVVSGAPRSSVAVATMMPGVTSAGGNNAFNARINGGIITGDEAIVDGVTTSEGFMNQSGMVALQTDFGMSPDITSEVKILTANYDAQYGNTTSGQLIIQTKSGGERFHGGGYEYIRNDAFNAAQYGSTKGPDKENDFGAFVGGPWYVPGFHGDKSFFKGYFYFNWEGFQDHGGAVKAVDSITSTAARGGDFSGWGSQLYYPADAAKFGNLAGTAIPGNQIDPTFEDPIAKAWMAALPTPTNSNELSNYVIPKSGQSSLTNSENVYFARADLNIGQKDHLYYTYWWQYAGVNTNTDLPIALSNAGPANPENAPIQRFNWEHTLNSSMTNHFSIGYLNRNEGYYQLDRDSTLPKIPGVASDKDMPEMSFTNYTQLGTNRPADSGADLTTRGTYGLTDVFTFVRGRHTFKGGYEWKKAGTSIHNGSNRGGTFTFNPDTTGTTDKTLCPAGCPGDDMASFYLGAVGQAQTVYYNAPAEYPRQYGYAAHFGDVWRVTHKLTANLSLRWDYITPFADKENRLSFFDPVGENPGTFNTATGKDLPGRLAYAGTGWGDASYGKPYPEIPFKKGIAPRVGFAYALDEKTVIRAGYGIYYAQAFYPGWDGGMSQDGFNKTVTVSESPSGSFKTPAIYLANGISAAQTGSTAPIISSTFDNGSTTIKYRPLDGNRRPYSQQWNLTVERQLPSNFFLQVSYVGTKGTHLPSDLSPLNVLNPNDPTVQSLGTQLNDVFAPGQTTLDGISIPYDNFVSDLGSSCATVAQALLPYPMLCNRLQGQNEQHATSIYNSFQAKVEHHLSHGLYLLADTTIQKMYTDASDTVQSGNTAGTGNQGNNGQFSPFNEKPRAWTIVPDNVPVTVQATLIYDLPFGKGQRFAGGGGASNMIVGGWQVIPLFHYDYGTPFSFYSSTCATSNLAPALREGCIPGILPGQTVQLGGRNGFNPKSGGQYFNALAFEPASAFNNFGYTGTGNAVTSVYGPSYKNFDISLTKNTKIAERVNFKFAANFFNAFNNHALIASQGGNYGGPSVAFVTDVSKVGDPKNPFGSWNGGTSAPRTIQFSGRLEF